MNGIKVMAAMVVLLWGLRGCSDLRLGLSPQRLHPGRAHCAAASARNLPPLRCLSPLRCFGLPLDRISAMVACQTGICTLCPISGISLMRHGARSGYLSCMLFRLLCWLSSCVLSVCRSREKKPYRLLFPWHCFCSRFRSHAHSTSRRTHDG